jgi:hypothetical protein
LQGASAALSAIFFSIAYMQFLGLAECAETMLGLPVFWKQKFALFFPSWAYAIPFALIKVPVMLLEVTCWSVFVYWVVGLEANAGRCVVPLYRPICCCFCVPTLAVSQRFALFFLSWLP